MTRNDDALTTVHLPSTAEALAGCRDMLRESAKQFRQLGDTGHARMADRHADAADVALGVSASGYCTKLVYRLNDRPGLCGLPANGTRCLVHEDAQS